ncbi:LytR/AlgR family response regulator transcription factor [Desulfosporosinus hippei]|uniref:Stage 0 sporulation protein A homolog n=1 Tax=Desulfosporosinus hippei DSM 8344 TaxID=1121419 RepID=A0A1G7VQ91_9FIRM|nr:response regulator [Desulfosporosinus hippei]SDG61589.1 Response regulator receiver domain-containing protein [Desulfosporosinus hippei DSM 8344]
MFTIGICDDRPLSRYLLEALIHLYEEEKDVLFNIYEFSSGEELLAEIEKQGLVFDLLFLDNSMKKLSGLETARQIRQSKSTSACSIVFVTSAEDHDQFMQVKPLRIVSKPSTQEHIEAILEKVLAKP